MYLYLGQDKVVNTADIVGIFDLENTSTSRLTKSYLAAAQKSGCVYAVGSDIPKSFVVCQGETGQRVLLSQISTATLKKRSAHFREFVK